MKTRYFLSYSLRIVAMNKPTIIGVRNRTFIEKLKLTGKFNAFKQKKAENEKARRQQLKVSLAQLSDSQRTQAIRQGRLKTLARVHKYREKKRKSPVTQADMEQQVSFSCVKIEKNSDLSMDNKRSVLSTYGKNGKDDSERCISNSCRRPSGLYLPKSSHIKLNFEHSFKNDEELAETVAKVEKTLPSSPSKRKAVIAKLFYTLDGKSQREIVQNLSTIKRTGHKRIAPTLIQKIQRFYEREDISRESANVDDLINFANCLTGQKEVVRIRHLAYTLKQAYTLFNSENKNASVSLAKFCSLRPAHVKLCSKDFDVTSMLQVDFHESVSDVPDEDKPIIFRRRKTYPIREPMEL